MTCELILHMLVHCSQCPMLAYLGTFVLEIQAIDLTVLTVARQYHVAYLADEDVWLHPIVFLVLVQAILRIVASAEGSPEMQVNKLDMIYLL